MKAAVAAIIGLLGAACSQTSTSELEFRRVELPGFSLLLPNGEVTASSKTPAAGEHKLKLETSLVDHLRHDVAINGGVSVSWGAGSSTHEEWQRDYLPLYVSSLAQSVPGSRILDQGKIDENSWYAVIGTDRAPLAIGVLRCDPSFEVEVSYAHYHSLQPQLRDLKKILRSVRCAVTEKNLAPLIASTRLPAKFGAVSASNPQSYRSLDGEYLGLNFSAGNPASNRKTYLVVVNAVIEHTYNVKVDTSQIQEVALPTGSQSEPAVLLRVDVPPDKGRIYVGLVYCERDDLSVVSIWSAPEVSDPLALERLGQVDCPGAPSAPSPPFEPMVQAACEAGDKVACEVRENPM